MMQKQNLTFIYDARGHLNLEELKFFPAEWPSALKG
jgi:hypothetical protein